MKRIRWSPRALHDLRRQFSYLLQIDAALASSTVVTIDARAEWLAEHSLLGSPVMGGRRKLLVPDTPYLIFYRSDDAEVRILRVRHTAEDWRPR